VKKTAVVILIFLVFIGGYFYFNKPQRAQFTGATNLHLIRISPEGAELRGELVFHNPNKMRSQLGKLKFNVKLNDKEIGIIDESFSTAIKGEEDFHFAFQIRFPLPLDSTAASLPSDLPVLISGTAGSDVLFANYTFPIDFSGTVKNTLQ